MAGGAVLRLRRVEALTGSYGRRFRRARRTLCDVSRTCRALPVDRAARRAYGGHRVATEAQSESQRQP